MREGDETSADGLPRFSDSRSVGFASDFGSRISDFLRKRLLPAFNYGYLAGLFALLIALEWWGERHWLLSLLLYVPPAAFLLPLGVLTPLALLLRRWRLVLSQLLAVIVVAFGYMTFRWSPMPVAKSGSGITVVTFNAGQSDGPQFARFLATERPDIILLQDARSVTGNLQHLYPELFQASRDQFAILSKYPIAGLSLITLADSTDPVAARFEVTIREKPVAFYSVRMPTPRHQFNRLLKPAARRELWSQRERSLVLTEYWSWFARRIDLARALADVFRQEKAQFVVGGDFNIPDHGDTYHMFAGQMTDSFAKAGRGWGLTFPGEKKNGLAFLGPWLRLDYLFAGRGWHPTRCYAEPAHKSQHRAVVARLEPEATP